MIVITSIILLLLLFYEMANEKVLLSVIIYLDFLVSISNSGCKSSPLGGECSMQSPDEVHERCEHKNSPYSRNCNDYTDEQHNAVKRCVRLL